VTAKSPPLPHEEVRRILADLRQLSEKHHVVVIGGQAVYFWAYYFSQRMPGLLSGAPPTSKDLDICGDKQAVVQAAKLLHGEPRLPAFEHMSPNAGIVEFRDSEGYDRVLDVIAEPYGLKREDVIRTSLRVTIEGDGKPVPFYVMNPVVCMESRVKNVGGLGIQTPHALRQLRASIPCARAFLAELLDVTDEELQNRRRMVHRWNQRIYRFARSDRDARKVQRAHGIDAFDAVLVDDDGLSAQFREDGYKRWRDDLNRRRRRSERDRERRAAQASASKRRGPRRTL
jgi:hypothetical protein